MVYLLAKLKVPVYYVQRHADVPTDSLEAMAAYYVQVTDAVIILIIYLKRLSFTLHWSNRAIFSAYCTESSAYCTELSSHVHQNYFCFEMRNIGSHLVVDSN